MQSLAEAYTCPSKGIGSPSRYRTPRDRAKEKETTSLPLARSLAGRRSFARCWLLACTYRVSFVGPSVGSAIRWFDRPIGRSIARALVTRQLALSIRDNTEQGRSSLLRFAARRETGRHETGRDERKRDETRSKTKEKKRGTIERDNDADDDEGSRRTI